MRLASADEPFNPDDRLFLVEEVLRSITRRETMLYYHLATHGMTLPEPRMDGAALFGIIDWRQQRALFREIQFRGAFTYPGMRQYYVDDNGQVLRDVLIFQELREVGAVWHWENAWLLPDSTMMWNERNTGRNQSEYAPPSHPRTGRVDPAEPPIVRANNRASFNALAESISSWEV